MCFMSVTAVLSGWDEDVYVHAGHADQTAEVRGYLEFPSPLACFTALTTHFTTHICFIDLFSRHY